MNPSITTTFRNIISNWGEMETQWNSYSYDNIARWMRLLTDQFVADYPSDKDAIEAIYRDERAMLNLYRGMNGTHL